MTDQRRWLESPVESGSKAGFGVYLHVPFCAHRCGYCDFATSDRHDAWQDRYVAALRDHVRRTVAAGRGADGGAWPTVTSIFVGGGTPTLLAPDALASLLGVVGEELEVAADAEVTVECNPETATPEMFAALLGAGLTRLSLGAQSFTPGLLELLERGHGPDTIAAAVHVAREAGVPELSLDLMFGTPGETDEDWARTLTSAMALAPDHLSAYALTIHDNTPFGRRVAQGTLASPDPDVQRTRFDVADEILGVGGFVHYEISNWSLGPAKRSRHNELYWRHGDYLGLGVGAHGHHDGTRTWESRSIESWVTAVEAEESPVAGSETLDDDERATERLLLGLRLREGLHPLDAPPIEPMALEDAMDHDLVTTACGRLQSTEAGWFLLDEAVLRLR